MYIEDNPANLRLVSQIIKRRKNLTLLSAHTAKLGIELAISNEPNLILLDINLPDMNGYEVLENLKKDEQTKNIPIIAISANAMPDDIKHGISAGFDEYLTKPIDATQLLGTLDHYLCDEELIN